ncbi:hypothetical protein GWK47_039005 [Chionoecetes opilio]|uniref:Uncharacterized protein n=1 Tax=Chionoecetes opilio TaxID=41210 RepID=A0A8J4YER1_CHIOP|nr:hypothetical protein GWK47_039005 [Chionoecetes opilio]
MTFREARRLSREPAEVERNKWVTMGMWSYAADGCVAVKLSTSVSFLEFAGLVNNLPVRCSSLTNDVCDIYRVALEGKGDEVCIVPANQGPRRAFPEGHCREENDQWPHCSVPTPLFSREGLEKRKAVTSSWRSKVALDHCVLANLPLARLQARPCLPPHLWGNAERSLFAPPRPRHLKGPGEGHKGKATGEGALVGRSSSVEWSGTCPVGQSGTADVGASRAWRVGAWLVGARAGEPVLGPVPQLLPQPLSPASRPFSVL